MKLIFSKNENLEISVRQIIDGANKEFNYVEMVKKLIETRKLEAPEIEGDFSDSEKQSINSMIAHINSDVLEFYSEDDA